MKPLRLQIARFRLPWLWWAPSFAGFSSSTSASCAKISLIRLLAVLRLWILSRQKHLSTSVMYQLPQRAPASYSGVAKTHFSFTFTSIHMNAASMLLHMFLPVVESPNRSGAASDVSQRWPVEQNKFRHSKIIMLKDQAYKFKVC